MRFLNDNDYVALIRKEIKDIITASDYTDINEDTKILTAENMAIDQIKNSLSGRYDTTAIFSAQDEERDNYIVMIAIDCTLYHLYTAIAPNLIPEHRSTRYQDAVDWLKDVRKGDANANLPRYKDEQGNDQFDFRISSERTNENNKW